MRIISLNVSHSGQQIVFDEGETDILIDTIREMLPELASGEQLQIKAVEMDDSEYMELPEFEGW